MAEDYPHTAFPMLLDLPQERFYPQAMCRAMGAIKPSEMNGILSDLRKNLALKHPVSADRMLIDGAVITSEGTKCELLSFGYNPAGARKRQITIFLAVTEGGEHSDSPPYCQGVCQGIQHFSRDTLGSKIGETDFYNDRR